jgi:sulfate/thiosulfate-binding protein
LPSTPHVNRKRRIAVAALAGAVVAAGVAGTAVASGGSLTLVAYSTPQVAFTKIISQFQKTPQGRGWTFNQSYGPSGAQSRAVASGLSADIVNFATEPDVTRLVKAGKVADNWQANTHQGILTNSIVVFIVRKGNPKHIHTWADLLKPGVKVLTPNPQTSGGARWNILAAYGAQLVQHKSTDQANAYLKSFFKHVPVQDASARDALNTFHNGVGDVLLDYESEAFFAKTHGFHYPYNIPTQTILIQTPVAVLKTSSNLPEAQAFENYLWSAPAQTIFAKLGFRPVNRAVGKKYARSFPHPAKLFTIGLFGGWTAANQTFFSANGLVAQAQQ